MESLNTSLTTCSQGELGSILIKHPDYSTKAAVNKAITTSYMLMPVRGGGYSNY